MSTTDTITHLTIRLAELSVEIIERQTELDRLTNEHDALNIALRSLQDIQGGVLDHAIGDGSDGELTYRQKLVYEKVPFGQSNALTPALISKRCTELSSDYVRKTLARFSRYGRIKSHDSKYWREAV